MQVARIQKWEIGHLILVGLSWKQLLDKYS